MLTANNSKIKKSALPDIAFILTIFVWMNVLLKLKKMLISQKYVLHNKTAWACVKMGKYIALQVSLVWYNTFI